MDYILKAENLTKIYGHHKALDNFSIHIPQGSTYGLVGKNGAGKTTLLRIICGLQEATSGDYSLYGISSRKHEILNARKEMGAVIETPAIYLDMSATGNLKEQYRVLGLRSFDTIPQLLKMVGLEDEAMVTGMVAFKVYPIKEPVFVPSAFSYFPNKSLCVPVRDNVKTSKSFSIR